MSGGGVHRFLRAVNTVLFLAAVVAALAEHRERGDLFFGASGGPSSPTTTTTTVPPTTAPPPPTTAAAPATTRATVPRTTVTTQPAPTLSLAARGQYTYRVTFTDEDTAAEENRAFSRGQPVEEEGELRQAELGVTIDSRSTSKYALRSDGLYVRMFSEGDAHCDPEPDMLLYPSPLPVGRQWTSEAQCATDDQEEPVLRANARVLRVERATALGRSVEVHVVERTGRASEDGESMEFRAVEWFSIELGVIIREETTYRYTAGTDSYELRETSELVSFTPKS